MAGNNDAVAVKDVASRVAAVLARAESLFAAPTEPLGAGAEASSLGPAAQTAEAIAARTADMSGATVREHGDVAATSAERLVRMSETDHRLAENLERSAQFHDAGRSQAAGIRTAAADVSPQLQPWAGVPTAEVAGLKVLRSQLAAMQILLARHRAAAARTAADISTLRYRPDGELPASPNAPPNFAS
jgi:hypothetical protein